ncbi:polysaccharide biosynthesis tyrosine autokinase [Halomonas getboli]|uniref:polysaccharide biosynthesis tyrosine autokinase n=1 Tax=Halomonas getboli TaxID=2935862 RepID=UPI001FFE58BE|nr:polysaccharide biosynthesis tyrosine autokinase [Halomonas getboli]MCK2183056.1 polysaccharide biosynthesis tyrosine autokinase [Halomonas getboli]
MTVFPSHPAGEPSSQETPDISLGKLLATLLDHKWAILFTALAFLVAGYLYATSQPRIYQADALIQVENRGPGLGVLDGLAVGNPMANPASAEMEILQSRLVMGETVDRLDLAVQIEPRRLPWLGNVLVHHGVTREWADRLMPDAILARWPGAAWGNGMPYVWAGESLAVSRFEVPRERLGDAYRLKVTGPATVELWDDSGRVLAGRVGETLIDDAGHRLFVSRLVAHLGAEFQITRVSRLQAIGALQRRFTIVPRAAGSGVFQLTLNGPDRERIDTILDTITGVFLSQNVQRQSEEAAKQIAFLDEQIPQVNAQLTAAENRLNDYRAQRDSVDLNFETQTLLGSLVDVENRLADLALAEADLAERFRPTHPNYQALLRQRAQLTEQKRQLESQVGQLPETQQEVLRLNRDAQVNQQIFVQLLNQRQEMRLIKAGTVGNVRILDPAVLLRGTIAPQVPLVSVASGLFGALLAMVVVVLRLVLSRSVESTDQLEDLGLPVYAAVPSSARQSRMTRRVRRRHARQGQNVFRGLLAAADAEDMAIESLRALRTSLYFAMLEARNNRLMITGASPEVGKSFVAANLAAICAQAGQRVLLVDADLRRGHLHHAFRADADEGLSDLLAQRIDLATAIRASGIEGLDYVARGRVPPNPSELLMQHGFHDFLERVSQDYELVVLDTPPVLAVTDAAVVGKLAGTSLMVVRFGRNTLKEVRAAKRRLEHGGVHLKGTILNGVEKSAGARYGYDGSYLYAYR